MPEEKKIIIDEDWKSQVQAEKERAAKSVGAESEAAGPGASDAPMPPATFEMLLTTLATEALVAMEQVAHPATGQAHVEPNQARYLIDTIDVLREKTKGNLTPSEQQLIESLLHQLRMVFLATANQPAGAKTAPSNPSVE